MKKRNVVLTGFMGTGKTTVGRLLADLIGYDFVDTDDLIIERHGPIADIFSASGESGFRQVERGIAAELADRHRLVVSTGGRLMLDPMNQESLGSSGEVFCLSAPAEEIVRRVVTDEKGPVRPLLAGDDPETRVRALLEERAAGYALFEQVHTAGRSPSDIAADIAARIRSRKELE